MIQLADISESEQDQMDARLERLASEEGGHNETEARKWVIVMLEAELTRLPADPLYGLLRLTEFWSDIGYPSYSPHQVQGKGNEVGPKDYYTPKNFKRALEQHKAWIERESQDLLSGRC